MAFDPLFPDDQHVQESNAFLALRDILKADPGLAAVVSTWRTWEGDPDDDAAPTPEECPWVRLTPSVSQIAVAEVDAYGLNMRVLVETAVRGTRAVDNLDLWGTLRAALQKSNPYGNTTVAGQLRTAGQVYEYEIVEPTVAVARPTADAQGKGKMLVATGAIVLRFFVAN